MTNINFSERPDPDALLAAMSTRGKKKREGRLYLFLGMAPGVGKTYAMLLAAREAQKRNVDVVIGVVESHGREETQALMQNLEIIPKRKSDYRGITIEEMDIDSILQRKPKIVCIDELAHSNAPNSRHAKRWQDINEVLDAGIDVFSTLNIQHLESRKELVEQIAGITVRETVPDSILDRAYQIRLIDLSPEDLLKRLKEGKVYLGDKADLAAANFFKEENLSALREMSLRLAAEKVDYDQSTKRFSTAERLLVAVDAYYDEEQLLRATRKLAFNLDASWIAVYVDAGSLLSEKSKGIVKKNLDFARILGAEVITIADVDVANALLRIAHTRNVSHIVVSNHAKKSFKDYLFPRHHIVQKLLKRSDISLCIINTEQSSSNNWFTLAWHPSSPLYSYFKSLSIIVLISLISQLLLPLAGYQAIGFFLLMTVIILGLFFSLGPVVVAASMSAVIWNYFFIPPVGGFYIQRPEDVFMWCSYVVAAVSTGALTRRIRKQQEILNQREQRALVLHEIIWDIARSPVKKSIIAAVTNRIENFLQGNCDVSLLRKNGSLYPFNEKKFPLSSVEREMAVARWALDNNKQAGWSTETLSSSEALYIPLQGPSQTVGVLAFKPEDMRVLSPEDNDMLATISRQLALALERELFREKGSEAERLMESEKSIKAVLSRLAQENEVNATTQQLHFAIENALASARLITGIYPLKRERIDVRALCNHAWGKLSFIVPKPTLDLGGGEDEVELFVETGLVSLALANIFLNALSNATIKLNIHATDEEVSIAVAHYDSNEDVEEMAKGIARAHGGRVVVTRNDVDDKNTLTLIFRITPL